MKPKPIFLLAVFATLFIISLLSFQNKKRGDKQAVTTQDTVLIDTAQARIYYEKGRVYKTKAQADSALIFLKKALLIYEKAVVVFDDSTSWARLLVVHNGIGFTYNDKAVFDTALYHYNEALKISKNVFNDKNDHVANTYNLLGLIYSRQNDFKQALDYYEKALQTQRAISGEFHENIGNSLLNIGNHYFIRKELDKAEDFFNQSLNVRLKVHEHTHFKISECYNNLGIVNHQRGNYAKAIVYLKKALKIREQLLGENHPWLGSVYSNIAAVSKIYGDYEEAEVYFQKALSNQIGAYGDSHPNLAKFYVNIGAVYGSKGYTEEAINYLKKSISIFGTERPEAYMSYYNIGINYRKLGDYEKALEYYEKAIQLHKGITQQSNIDVARIYFSIGSIHEEKSEYDLALNFYQKAYQINNRILGTKHLTVAENLSGIGNYYRLRGDYQQALSYYQQALVIRKDIFGEGHYLLAETYHQIGQVQYNLKAYNAAMNNYTTALQSLRAVFPEGNPRMTPIYRSIGSYYADMDAPSDALGYYLQALNTLLPELKHFKKIENPTIDELALSLELIKLLNLKAAAINQLAIKNNNDLNLFNQSLETYQLTIAIAERYRTTLSRQSSKKVNLNFIDNIFEKAINLAFGVYSQTNDPAHFSLALSFCEKSKSALLSESLQEIEAKSFVGIPDTLIEMENRLKTNLTFYENKIFEERDQDGVSDSTKLALWSDKVFHFKQKLDVLQVLFKNKYPKYHQLKYSLEVVDVKTIQHKLPDSETVLLNYFLGDSSLFVFVIRENSFEVKELQRSNDLETKVKQLRTSIFQAPIAIQDSDSAYQFVIQQYIHNAHWLYRELMTSTKVLPKKLIIIPDGILNYLPFDVLLKAWPEQPDLFASYSYLIKEYQMSYAYSATLWVEMLSKQQKKKSKNLLAVAPLFEADSLIHSLDIATRRNALGSLKYNIPEAKTIHQLSSGTLLTGVDATKQQFIEQAPNHRILHLATHAKSNDVKGDYSFLAFKETLDSSGSEKLYVRDLYNLSLDAEMVVLSACETGVGELQKGEGVISLSWGFVYAGAKSLVTSLWSINDRSSREIMELFYRKLKENQTKDEALRNAKLSYLKSQHTRAHPFYWAAFTPLGDMSPIDLGQRSMLWWYLVGAVAIGVIAFIYLRTKK